MQTENPAARSRRGFYMVLAFEMQDLDQLVKLILRQLEHAVNTEAELSFIAPVGREADTVGVARKLEFCFFGGACDRPSLREDGGQAIIILGIQYHSPAGITLFPPQLSIKKEKSSSNLHILVSGISKSPSDTQPPSLPKEN